MITFAELLKRMGIWNIFTKVASTSTTLDIIGKIVNSAIDSVIKTGKDKIEGNLEEIKRRLIAQLTEQVEERIQRLKVQIIKFVILALVIQTLIIVATILLLK